jgi:DNA-binding beta-propeller fold protein YncE
MKNSEVRRSTFCGRAAAALAMLSVGWLAGCGSAPRKPARPQYIFYPRSPQPPRLQFLVKFAEEKDRGQRPSKFATMITGVTPSSEPILKPYGVALAAGRLYVCDTGARAVQILDLAARTMRSFSPGGMGKMGTPVNVAIDADGTRYVADTGRNQVLIYGSDDTFSGAIGEEGDLRPTSVALTQDRIYVADLKGHCVRVYAKAGHTPLFTIPRHPEASEEQQPGKLYMPVNLALDQAGHIYVSDMAACNVRVYDAEGKHLWSFGAAGDLPGQFARPKGVAVDREGRIFVVDAAAQVCQIFDAKGRLLLFFGEPGGSDAPLNLPAAVAVDYDHLAWFQKYAAPDFVLEELVIITSQYGDNKVSVYGLGHKS